MRKVLLVLIALALGALVVIRVGVGRLEAAIASGAMERTLVDLVREALGIEVRLGAIRLATWPEIRVEGVAIPELEGDPARAGIFELGALAIRFDPGRLFAGELRIDEIRVEGLALSLAKDAAGVLNVRALVERIKAHRAARALAARSDADRVIEELEALNRDMEARLERQAPSGAPTGPVTPAPGATPSPAAPAPSAPPPPPAAAPAAPRDPFAGPVRVGRIRVLGAKVAYRDESLGREPFFGLVEGLDLTVALPPPGGRQVELSLAARLQGAPFEVVGRLDPMARKGNLQLKLAGLPLGSVQPFLQRIPVPVDLGRIPLHLDAAVELDGTPVDYRVDLRIPRSSVRVAAAGRELAAGFDVAVTVRPGRASLDALHLELAEVLGLELTGAVTDFADPRVEARLVTTSFSSGGLIGLLPEASRERLAALAPTLALALDARVTGKLRDRSSLRPDLKLVVGPGTAAIPVRGLAFPVALAPVTVASDGERLTVEGLGIEVGGVRVLAGKLAVDDLRALPRARLELGVPGLELARVLEALQALPGGDEGVAAARTRLAGLGLRGGLGLELGLDLNLAALSELETFAAVRTVPDLVALLKADPALAAELRKPEMIRALVGLGVADLALRLEAKGVGATLVRGPLTLPVALDLALAAGPGGVVLEPLSVRAAGGELKARARLEEPLGARRLEAAVSLGREGGGPLDLPSLVALLPEETRARIARLSPTGTLAVSVEASGPLTGTTFTAGVHLAGLGATVPTSHGVPIELRIPALDLAARREGATLGPVSILTPLGELRLSADLADPLGRKTFRARLRTTEDGLELTKALALLPPERRERLKDWRLPPLPLRLQLDATGTPEAPAVELKLGLGLPGGTLAARAEARDLKQAKAVAFELGTAGEGLRLGDLVAILPEAVQARFRTPPFGRLGLRVAGQGKLAEPASLGIEARLEGELPGGRIDLGASLADPLGARRLDGTLELAITRLGELLAFAPPELADKVAALSPAADFGITLDFRGDRGKVVGDAEVGFRSASALVKTPEKSLPVRVHPLAARARLVFEPGVDEAPFKLDVLGGLTARVGIEDPVHGPIELDLQARDVHYDRRDVVIPALTLSSVATTLVVSGTVKDVKGARELDLGADLALKLPELVARFVPPEAQMRVTGLLAGRVTVGGSVVRPEPAADLTLSDFFLDAYKLRGHPVAIPALRLKIRKDDLVLEPFTLSMGGKDSDFFLSGSMKELAAVDNFWVALRERREEVVARMAEVVKAKGGKKAIVQMVGNDTLLRILGSSSHKLIVHIESDDLPRPHTFKTLLTGDETKEFEFRRDEILEKYTALALQEVYGKQGIGPKLFGSRYQGIMNAKGVTVVVLDQRFNMVYPRKVPFWRLVTTPTEF